MISGVYSAASALRTAELQQEVIATNLAHMNVPGFRRLTAVTSTFVEELPPGEEEGETVYGIEVERIASDFSLGPLQDTGRSLDVALMGDGFLAVQGENEELYTRSGSLHIGEDGLLVGTHGMPVLGENGTITIPANVSPQQIVISTDGVISAGAIQIGQLRLVAFEDNAALEQVGTTLFSAPPGTATADAEVGVRQGIREQSNVSPVTEMVGMIVALRYHEAAQRTLKSMNDALQLQTDPAG